MSRPLTTALLPVVAPIVVFAQGLAGRMVIAPNDGYQLNMPVRVLAARIWRSGTVPAWNEFEFSGYPLLASSVAGVLYPPHLLYVVLAPLAANNLSVVLHFAFAGLGAWLLARRLVDDGVAAAVGGLAFGLSGFFFGHVGHQNMVESAVWLPWLFLGFELVLERPTALRIALGGGALALSIVAGHAQISFLMLPGLGIYALVLAILRTASPVRLLLSAGAVVAVGFALAAPQVVPTAQILASTSRSMLPFTDAMSFSFPLSHLTLIAFPLAFGAHIASDPVVAAYRGEWNLIELSGYPGLAAVVVAAASVPGARRHGRVVAFAAVGAFGVLLALGSAAPIGRLVYALPVYGGFRAWGRAVLLLDFAIAMLAAYGTAALRSEAWPHRRRAAHAAVAAACLLVALALVLPHVAVVGRLLGDGGDRAFAFGMPLAAALAAAALATAVAVDRLPRVAAGAVVAIVALDLVASYGIFGDWRTGSPSVRRYDRDYSTGASAVFGDVATAPGGVDRAAVTDVTGTPLIGPYASRAGPFDTPKVTVSLGVRTIGGYDTLVPAEYLTAVGGMTPWGDVDSGSLLADGSDVLDVLRVTTLVFDATTAPPVEGLRPARRVLGDLHRIDRIPRLPEAYVVGHVQHRARADVVAALHGALPWDPGERALVDSECRPCHRMRTAGMVGRVMSTARRHGGIDVKVDAHRAGLLVVSEAWFPGWHAEVDGRGVKVVRANGLVLGVPLDRGDHLVRLRYRAPGLRVGTAVAGVTVAGLGALWWVDRRRRASVLGHPDGAQPASSPHSFDSA